MCGIVGAWSRGASDLETLEGIVRVMRDALTHRGPDDAGLSVEPSDGLVLGHRRLSILDLSMEGRQPMASPSGRFVVVFNGEVYNHLRLRQALPAVWRGTSDTETMLAAFDAWGIERSLQQFVGMFAIAIWDRREHALHLVRDRLGIKPLYWGHSGDGALLFGSELHALRAHPNFDVAVDGEALAAYFETSCVPAPLSIHRAARKVMPGTVLTFTAPTQPPNEAVFWSARDQYEKGAAEPLDGDDDELLDQVESAIREAVQLRLLADVPLGAFLSGGIDSSLVVALAQELSASPIRTFSIGSADVAYDESQFAAEVARRLGTQHSSLTVSGADALAVVPALPSMYDEPFADSSQIPTFLVSRLARADVTVSLSGDGGDEVFGGYNRYLWAPRIASGAARLPRSIRAGVSSVLLKVPENRWDAMHSRLSPPLPRARLLGNKIHKAARAIRVDSVEEMLALFRGNWLESPVAGARLRGRVDASTKLRPAGRLMLRDLLEYLPDDILTKVDRASMAVGLEARVPLLDHRVVELAARLPGRMKIRGRQSKWALRELLARRLPRDVFERPKTGFSVPIGAWLRGPLREWGEALLGTKALEDAGLDARYVRAQWRAHLDGRSDLGLAMWDVLVFRAWEDGVRAVTRTSQLGLRVSA